MPDGVADAVDGRPEPPRTYTPLGGLVYEPSISYRGKILWHHQSDAMDYARGLAHQTHTRYEVKAQRVPGWRHLLWRAQPVAVELHFTRTGMHTADECADPGCAGLRG